VFFWKVSHTHTKCLCFGLHRYFDEYKQPSFMMKLTWTKCYKWLLSLNRCQVYRTRPEPVQSKPLEAWPVWVSGPQRRSFHSVWVIRTPISMLLAHLETSYALVLHVVQVSIWAEISTSLSAKQHRCTLFIHTAGYLRAGLTVQRKLWCCSLSWVN